MRDLIKRLDSLRWEIYHLEKQGLSTKQLDKEELSLLDQISAAKEAAELARPPDPRRTCVQVAKELNAVARGVDAKITEKEFNKIVREIMKMTDEELAAKGYKRTVNEAGRIGYEVLT